MTNFEIWKNAIKAKLYTKQVAIRRVNVVAPLFTDEEFIELIELIEQVYG